MLTFLVTALCASICHAQVDLLTVAISPSQNYNVPVDPDKLIVFVCTANSPTILWMANGMSASELEIVNKGVIVSPTMEVEDTGNYSSSISIPARKLNDNTSVQCGAYDISGPSTARSGPVLSSLLFVRVQGPLSPPPNLSLTEPGDQLTRTLTWDAPETLDLTDIEPDIEFYQVCYNVSSDDLTCVNVSSSERREFIFPNVCVPLIFTVTAFNVVGEGNASKIVHNGSSATCDKNTPVSSRGHQVSFIQPGNYPTVTLFITQNVPGPEETCVCIYEVQTSLNISESNTTNHGPQIPEVISYSGDAGIIELALTVAVDVDNEIFSAAVAVSAEGHGSTIVEFSTYDIQAVDISALPGGLELSCTFANGSQARSCILTVCGVENEVIDEGSCANITTTRSTQSLTSSTRHVVSPPGVYSIREVIEVESDGEMTIVRLVTPTGLQTVTQQSRNSAIAGALATGIIFAGAAVVGVSVKI